MLRKAGKCYYKVFCSFVEVFNDSCSTNFTTPELQNNDTATLDRIMILKKGLQHMLSGVMNNTLEPRKVESYVNDMVERGAHTEELFIEMLDLDNLSDVFGRIVAKAMLCRVQELSVPPGRNDQHSSKSDIFDILIKMFLWGSIINSFSYTYTYL